MDLRQLTVYEHFGCVNMRAITFLYVDHAYQCPWRLTAVRRLSTSEQNITSGHITGRKLHF